MCSDFLVYSYVASLYLYPVIIFNCNHDPLCITMYPFTAGRSQTSSVFLTPHFLYLYSPSNSKTILGHSHSFSIPNNFFAFRSNKINKTFHCKKKPATMCYPESFALLTSTFSCKMQPSSKLSADFQIEDPCVTGNSCSVSGRTKSFSTSVCLFGGLSE